jgi:aromatic-L-amino-acid decarboxylase
LAGWTRSSWHCARIPPPCSVVWTRHPEAFRAAFAADGDYLAASEGGDDLRNYGPALGRRFRALKLWAVLRCYGSDGLQSLIREHVRLAAQFEQWVRDEPGWEIAAPRHFSTVCFRHCGLDNDELARAATATGQVFVATTRLAGRSVIRLPIGNAATTEDDVRVAWEVLRACAR